RSIAAIVSASGPVVAERAMYGDRRRWGTCSAGSQQLSRKWYMAEGCTAAGFETWVAVANPGDKPVDVTFQLQTDKGLAAGPSGTIQPRRRRTFDLSSSVTSYEVSALLEATGPVACERSMYGLGASGRMCAPVQGPLSYPFTADGSIACGHWPAGSTDYPYFGAPRAGTRLHAGIDIYPAAGEGTPVRAVKDGTVIKTGPFYTRYTGEQTFGVLVDHGDFVANYGEVQPPEAWVRPGARLLRGQVFARVSGTVQLHFEMYTPGTTSWSQWYGSQPANLLDPTPEMLEVY
ncbi:MAG TPA: M23 family metallopeptidase, partial [Candidatus Anoxymicrobiaceae bacterium]